MEIIKQYLLRNFLLSENCGQEVGDQYIVGPPNLKLGRPVSTVSPVPTVVAPMDVCLNLLRSPNANETESVQTRRMAKSSVRPPGI